MIKNIVNSILQFLTTINDHYANLFLFIIAVVSAIIVYKEYLLRRRPYVIPEIVFEENEGNWFFHIILVNKGEYPSIAKITKAVLKIGDEEHPTIFNFEAILSPNEKQKVAPIGHINQVGRNRILGHEYRSNRVEILVELYSKWLGQKKFKYLTVMEYEVDVSGTQPIFKLIKEKMI